jgi:hypothetical protein
VRPQHRRIDIRRGAPHETAALAGIADAQDLLMLPAAGDRAHESAGFRLIHALYRLSWMRRSASNPGLGAWIESARGPGEEEHPARS